MHSTETPSRVKYAGRGQHSTHSSSQDFGKAKLSPALQRWLQERPDEGHWTGLTFFERHRTVASPKRDSWSPLSSPRRSYDLPIRVIATITKNVDSVIGQKDPATHPLPQDHTADSDDSRETDTPPSSDKEAIEPDELRLLARKRMSRSHLAFVQQSPEGCLVPEETMSLASSHKRCIASRSHSPDEKVHCKSQKRRKSGRAKGRPENSGLSFACLFYKRDPIAYGGENGCSAWCNESIETVVRHHILDKHRKANKQRIADNEDHCLDDERFEEVAKFKRQRIPGKSKEKYAEETWKAVYALLFGIDVEAKDEIPDPYFVSTTRPNNSGFNISDIEKIIQRRVSEDPSLVLQYGYYYRQKEKCERDRQREKENLRLAADKQKGELKVKIGQLKIQIREIDEQQARNAQKIDDYYEERISNNHSQLMAIFTGQPDAQTQFPPDSLARPVPSLETSFGFEPSVPMHVSRSQISGFVQGYADTQFGFAERDTEDVLRRNDGATSPTATSAQLGSSNPSYPMKNCPFCSTANSSESLLCEECSSLRGFEEM